MKIVAVRNLTRQPIPCVPFEKVSQSVLPNWEISLVFVGKKRARDINISTRKKDYVPNVLSYIVGEKSAEIIICPTEASKQMKKFMLTNHSFVLFLFIHALLHLKGYQHGTTMEQYEQKLLTRFGKS